MRITKEELREFNQIYLEETGKKLPDFEAMNEALNFLTGIEMLLIKPKVQSNPVRGIDKKWTK